MKEELLRDVEMVSLALDINGEPTPLLVPVHKTLLEVLREDMNLTGTKHGCELGECGTCTVLVDGQPELSCLILPIQIEGRAITTVEGASCLPRARCSRPIPSRRAMRSVKRWPATCAAAPAT